MKRSLRTIAAASLILVSMSLVAGCSKSDNKSTNPPGGTTLELSSGDMGGGAVYPHRFFTAGTFNYHCARHPTVMKAKIIVSLTAPAGDSLASVSITDFAFTSSSVTIPVDGKVTWTNNSGGTLHTVTSDP